MAHAAGSTTGEVSRNHGRRDSVLETEGVGEAMYYGNVREGSVAQRDWQRFSDNGFYSASSSSQCYEARMEKVAADSEYEKTSLHHRAAPLHWIWELVHWTFVLLSLFSHAISIITIPLVYRAIVYRWKKDHGLD